MEYKNCIVFLMGFSGSGKRTIAQEIAKYPYFKLFDNMVINSPVINFLDMKALNYRVPEAAWQQINKIRDQVCRYARYAFRPS
jgi:adenylate kinase family enzyme